MSAVSRMDLISRIEALPKLPVKDYVVALEQLLAKARFRQELWVEFGHIHHPTPGLSTDFEYCDDSEIRGRRRWKLGYTPFRGKWGIIFCNRVDLAIPPVRISRDPRGLTLATPYLASLVNRILLELKTRGETT